ncbi:MAG: 3-deoxy-D-manno-octulosonic acid transferase [Candidatus Tectimicrobiota bacterium]
MYLLYTLCLILGGLLLLPGVLWRCLRGASYHHDLAERFGRGRLAAPGPEVAAGGLWFHAASVGEVQGIQPIIAALRRQVPTMPVVLSTFTPAGKHLAQRLVPEAAVIFVLPWDFPWLMQRLLRRFQPRLLVIQETELWPNLLRAAARQQVPVALVNGRLSQRSFQRYRWLRPGMRRVLDHVTLLLAQSASSAQRLRCLGAAAERLHVAGNTNIDRALLAAEQPGSPPVIAPWVHGRRLLVAGSTHEGEEAVLLEVYRRLASRYADLLLVLAPRHLERLDTVLRLIQRSPYQALRRSDYAAWPETAGSGPAVILLDTMGELAGLYSLSTVAFVGGSLVPVGGHNILEPAVYARPVFFGPHMHHFPELAAMLCQAGGAMQIHGPDDFTEHLRRLLEAPEEAAAMGQRAFCALAANRGALERTTGHLLTLLRAGASGPQG